MLALAADSAPEADGVRAEPENILEVEDLRTYILADEGVVRAVDGVSLEIAPGETVGLVGESGSGKSLTGLSIMGLIDPPGRIVSGRVAFNGRDIARLPQRELRRLRGGSIGMVFQDPMTSLNPVKRIAGQIAEGIQIHQRIGRRPAESRAVALLARMGVPSPSRALRGYPHQFSGGMRQRVMLAIGFGNAPSLIIADEPTTALDVTIQRQILTLLRELNSESGAAILLISHDLGVVASVCRRVAVMYAGEIVESGPAADVLSRPLHPYTQSLLDAVPRLDRPKAGDRRLRVIEGHPPDPRALPAGCRFEPRCPYRVAACAEHPELWAMVKDHRSRCWVAKSGALPWRKEEGPEPEAAARPGRTRTYGAPILEVEGLTKHYPLATGFFGRSRDVVHALDDVTFSVRKGETLGLVGESGSGKSTVARLVTRLTEPTAGAIRFRGTTITGLEPAAMRPVRRHLQMIFQDPFASLNPRMTVGQLIAEPYRFHHPEAGASAVDAKVDEILRRVGLAGAGVRERYPHEFSGGQRQRIGIARSLVLDPELIVADEPVSALDVNIQAQIINLMADIQDALDLTYIVIAHDLAVVRHISDRIGVMYMGRIVEIAKADDIFSAAAHPYTRLLLASVPIPDVAVEAGRTLKATAPEMPSAIHPPSGCRFRTRCPLARGICAEITPPLRALGEGHEVACHFPQSGGTAWWTPTET